MHFDETRLQKEVGNYRFAKSNALTDTTLLAHASEYRTNVSRKYVQLTSADIPERFSGDGDVLVSTKYDGEGVFLYYNADEDGPPFLFNAPSGRIRIGLKCIEAAAEKLKKAGVKKALLVGELYHPRMKGKPRPTVSDVITISFTGVAEELDRLAFAAFDAIMIDGQDWRKKANEFMATWERLAEILGEEDKDLAHRIAGQIVKENQVGKLFTQAEQEGEEGVVVRRLDRPEIYKLKPALAIDAVVIGYVEGEFEGKYGVTSLMLGLSGEDGVIREFGRVGSGLTDEERIRLLSELSVEKVDAPVIKTDSDGRPVSFVKPRLIVETSGENLEAENLSGRENLTQTFTYQDGKYQFHGLHPLPRLVHGVFSKFRDDKTFDDGGARLTQVLSEREVKEFSIEAAERKDAKIVRRHVYTKTTKGQVALRKFALVETDGVNRYPYVIVYTDISLGRKKPIDHTIKVARQRDQADELLDALIAENVKKGWEEDA